MNKQDFKDFLDEYRKPLLALVAALALIFAALISTDLRQSHVTLIIPIPGSTVLVDSSLHSATNSPLEKVELSLTPGQHLLLIAAEGRYPWAKEVTLSPGESEELLVFNFRENPLTETVPADHPAHDYTPPTEPIRLITSQDGNVELMSDGNMIEARWVGKSSNKFSAFCFEGKCRDTIIILESVRPIGDIGFLDTEGRVALFESAGNIYALELNTEGTQNFQPIYTGTSPRIIPAEGGVYVRDNGELRRIAL